MIFLYSESFENNQFELDFSIFQKACFYGQSPLGRLIFCMVIYFFSRFLLLSIYKKKLLKVSDHFVYKIQHESTTLIKKLCRIQPVEFFITELSFRKIRPEFLNTEFLQAVLYCMPGISLEILFLICIIFLLK